METRKYLFETLWKQFLAEQQSLSIKLSGPTQQDMIYKGQEDFASYHVLDALKALHDATKITREDGREGTAEFEMQGYLDANKAMEAIKSVLPSAMCKTVGNTQIECTFTLAESLFEQIGTVYNFYTDSMNPETHTYKVTAIVDDKKKLRDPANPRNITGETPTKKITLQWTNPPQGVPADSIVITKECGNETIRPPRGYKLDAKFIAWANGLC